jgi:hypothetical protein
MAFSLRLERFISRLGVVSLGVGSMFVGGLLCVLAGALGIGQFKVALGGIHKEVGFWSSLDWSMTFLVLLPLFLVFFALQIDHCALICRNFSEFRIVTNSDGSPVEERQLSAEWHAQLQAVSKAFCLLLVAAVIYSTSDWWMFSGKALWRGQLDGSELIDWSNGILYNKSAGDRWPIFGFTILAYIFHSVTAFSYLSGLLYSLTFALFLHRISTKSDTFRMVFKREFWEHLSGFYRNIYWAILIGLYGAFLVRLQAVYLTSNAPDITTFLIQDWGLAVLGPTVKGLLNLDIGTGFKPIPELAGKTDNSSWAALALTGFSLLCLIGVTYILYIVYLNTKNYFLAKIGDERWRRSVDLPDFSKAQIEQVRKARFSETVLTNPTNLGLLILLPLISMAFLAIGTLLVAAIIYAIFQLLLTRIRQLSRSSNPLTGATRDPHG